MTESASEITQYFSRLTDEQVLYLYSLHIGEVPSPFHKPKLTETLIQYLLAPQTAQAMAALLDDTDLAFLTACRLSHSGELRSIKKALMCRGFSETFIYRKISNLEERLVLLPLRGESPLRCSVNPVLLHALGYTLHIGILFPPGNTAEDIPGFHLTPSLLASWLSVINHRRSLFTGKGFIRRKKAHELDGIFPSFSGSLDMYDHLSQISLDLDLLRPSEGECSLHHKNIETLFTKPPASVLLFAACSFAENTRSFIRLLSLCRDLYIPWEYMIGSCILVCGCSRQQAEQWIDLLIQRSAVHQTDDRHCSFAPLYHAYLRLSGDLPVPRAVLSKDLKLHIEFFDDASRWFRIYRFCNLVQYDIMIIFSLTRHAVLLSLDSRYSLDDIEAAIEEVTGDALPQVAANILKDWASAFETLSIFRGIILSCDERTSRIIEHAPAVSELIQVKLAPGVYLFSEDDSRLLKSRLQDAGLPFVPHIQPLGEQKTAGSGDTRKERSFPELMLEQAPSPYEEMPVEDPAAAHILQELKDELKTITASREIQTELFYRIEQRLVLSKRQLKKSSKRRRIFEAKGFDYQGKLQLIRQALKSDSDMLEITMHQNTEDPVMVKAEELIKGDSSDILKGKTIPDEKPFSMAVGKLFQVRKIRKPLQLPKEET